MLDNFPPPENYKTAKFRLGQGIRVFHISYVLFLYANISDELWFSVYAVIQLSDNKNDFFTVSYTFPIHTLFTLFQIHIFLEFWFKKKYSECLLWLFLKRKWFSLSSSTSIRLWIRIRVSILKKTGSGSGFKYDWIRIRVVFWGSDQTLDSFFSKVRSESGFATQLARRLNRFH